MYTFLLHSKNIRGINQNNNNGRIRHIGRGMCGLKNNNYSMGYCFSFMFYVPITRWWFEIIYLPAVESI